MLIVFSGLDGAGKSTQIRLLNNFLVQQGLNPEQLWSRGGYTTWFEAFKSLFYDKNKKQNKKKTRADEIRGTVRQSDNKFIRQIWLFLAILDLCRVYGIQLRWALWQGKTIICDRYLWDTLVDFRTSFPNEEVDRWLVWKLLVWVTPRPDAAFLLLISVDEATRRLGKPSDPKLTAMLSLRLIEYQSLAKYWRVLDATASPADIGQQVREALHECCLPGLEHMYSQETIEMAGV